MMTFYSRAGCRAILAGIVVLTAGCATVQRSIGFNEVRVQAPQVETAERLTKLHATLQELKANPQPFAVGTLGVTKAEQQKLLDRLVSLVGDVRVVQADLEARSAARLSELAQLEQRYGRERGTLTLVGGGMSVLSLALLAANPAANAAWVAIFSGASTGVLTFHAARAEEGLTGRNYHERAEKISGVWMAAVASFYKGLGQAEAGAVKQDLYQTAQGVQEMLNAQAAEAAALVSDILVVVGGTPTTSVIGDALPSRSDAGKLAQKSALDQVIKRLQQSLIGVSTDLATKKTQSDTLRRVIDNPETETAEVQAARVDFAMLEKDVTALSAEKRLIEQQIAELERQITELGL